MRIYQKDGSSMWWVDFKDENGNRRRQSTGTRDKKLARALANKWENELFLEQHFDKLPEVMFRDALLRYAKERERKNPEGYKKNARYCLQMLLDRFGSLNLGDIDSRLLQDFADERLDCVSESTAKRELSDLKAIMNKARKEGRIVNVPHFPDLAADKKRCRWLTDDEEERLIAAATDHLKLVLIFAIDTGGRRSELLKLDWQNVDVENGLVTFIDTKNGEDRPIKLTDRAMTVLQEIGPKPFGPVFTYRGKAMKDTNSSFASACKKAHVENFRFHDLRHTFASRLVQEGISLYEVMKFTGHKSHAMVLRYAHLAPTSKLGL